MPAHTTRLSTRTNFHQLTGEKRPPMYACQEFAERYGLERHVVREAIRHDAANGKPILTRAIKVGSSTSCVSGGTRRYPLPDILRLARHHGLLPQRPAQSA